MTSEFLLEAIGQMDDELVMEAAVIKRPIPWTKVSGWAAALVLCVGVASLPGLLPMNGAGSGATAPEADLFLGDMVMDQDGKADGYEYRSEQESQVIDSAANKSESTPAASATAGLFEPKFFTDQGTYLPIVTDSGDLKQKMPPPENAIPLGKLAACVPGQQVYPATGTQALVGCPVWESEDGEFLYIQLPDGHWITAALFD